MESLWVATFDDDERIDGMVDLARFGLVKFSEFDDNRWVAFVEPPGEPPVLVTPAFSTLDRLVKAVTDFMDAAG